MSHSADNDAPRTGTIGDAEVCNRCGGENVIWCAPSPLWNYVMRDNDIRNAGSTFRDLVCIRCFIVLAEEAGVRGQWRVTTSDLPDDLIYETPSGRTWDADKWLWVEPTRVTPPGETDE